MFTLILGPCFMKRKYLSQTHATCLPTNHIKEIIIFKAQWFQKYSRNLPRNGNYFFLDSLCWWKSFKARLKHFPPPLLCLSFSSHLPKGFCNHFRLQFAWLSLSLFFSSLPQSPHFLCGMKLMFVLWNWKEREYFSSKGKELFQVIVNDHRKILL